MRRAAIHVLITAAVVIPLTCSNDPDAHDDVRPERFCPGSAGCEKGGSGALSVGAAARPITPTIDANTETLTTDVDGDAEYDPRIDAFDDVNGNGKFDGEWIAGFGNARAANGVHDEQWARAIALRDGDTTIAIVSVDAVGYFYDEIEMVRATLTDIDLDYLAVSATHTHEARDTVGIWGVTEDETGVDPAHMAFIRTRIAEAVREAVAALKPASVHYASLRTRDLPGGMIRYQSDSRDPKIIDDAIRLMRFNEKGTSTSIATLINWGSHPEYMGDENSLLSSDYPHWLREGVEKGVDHPNGRVDGIGGLAVFVSGALGSQIGPGRVRPADWSGTPVARNSTTAAAAVGSQLAYHVLQTLADPAKVTTDESATIGFASQTFLVDIQNRAYHTALLKSLFDRQAYGWDDERPLIPGENEPDIKSEVAIIDIGRAQIITIPGELDPALFVGGYDGSYTPAGLDIVDTSTRIVNPPDITKAPPGPYLQDLARPDAEFVFLFGLTNDMLGYFLPEFDYQLHEFNPYFDEAPGDHYEETNSVGPDGWPRIAAELNKLFAWRANQ